MPEVLGNLRPPRLAAAPSSPARGELYFDSTSNTLLYWNGTAWITAGGSTAVPVITSPTALPASPANGDEVYYQTPQTPIWHLRYNSTKGKWGALAGAAVGTSQAGAQANSALGGGAWVNIGPQVGYTPPLPGTYLVQIGASLINATIATTFWMMMMGPGLTNPAPPQDYAAAATAPINSYVTLTQNQLITVAAPLTPIFPSFWSTAAGSQNVTMRGAYVRIWPMQLG